MATPTWSASPLRQTTRRPREFRPWASARTSPLAPLQRRGAWPAKCMRRSVRWIGRTDGMGWWDDGMMGWWDDGMMGWWDDGIEIWIFQSSVFVRWLGEMGWFWKMKWKEIYWDTGNCMDSVEWDDFERRLFGGTFSPVVGKWRFGT